MTLTIYARSSVKEVVRTTPVKTVSEKISQNLHYQVLFRTKLLFHELLQGRFLHQVRNLFKSVADWKGNPVHLSVFIEEEVRVGYVVVAYYGALEPPRCP